jgi:RNA recognition motif-containing protein
MKIFVGNLPFSTTQEELESLFSESGAVTSVNIITDRFSGKSRGFGFVEMDNQEEAQAAIERLNGNELQGRPLTVNEARPQRERSRGPRRDGGDRNW